MMPKNPDGTFCRSNRDPTFRMQAGRSQIGGTMQVICPRCDERYDSKALDTLSEENTRLREEVTRLKEKEAAILAACSCPGCMSWKDPI